MLEKSSKKLFKKIKNKKIIIYLKIAKLYIILNINLYYQIKRY